ncbi:MAG: ATP-binding cassette domain-containing protein [Bacteroides sp.]|nr:ATP-binding cassette domain-containing protein [Bacteroides sp.]
MDKIELCHALPAVFAGSEAEPPVCDSHVWLRHIAFTRPAHYLIEAESGTGKSSLCSFIYGSRTDFTGDILFDGHSVREFDISRWCSLRRTALAYLPQEMHLFPELSVIDNILIKNRLTDFKSEAQIRRMLSRLEIDHKADSPAGRLSVGQQQRAAIVRALCQPFSFLLADEPVSHLDSRNNGAIASLIADEASERRAAVIATSVGNKILLPSPVILNL